MLTCSPPQKNRNISKGLLGSNVPLAKPHSQSLLLENKCYTVSSTLRKRCRPEGYVPWTAHLILNLIVKRKINNCPLAILDLLQFLTYFTGQMPTSIYASLKTNLIIKMTECQQSVSLPTRILKVPSVAPVII